jgi:adenylate cyclase
MGEYKGLIGLHFFTGECRPCQFLCKDCVHIALTFKDCGSGYERVVGCFAAHAYKEIEHITKDLDENSGYAFRQLEKANDELGRHLMELDFNARGHFAEPGHAAGCLQRFDDKIKALHVYLFNSYADLVFSSSNEENRSEGVGLVPLVQSLAKLKLRSAGKLKTRDKTFDVSLMDLVVESTGGSNLDEIRAILNNRENRAFEMGFSGRRSIFYVGQFTSRKLPGETFSLVMLIRDTHFERLYMRLMIEKICEQPVYKNRIQLYYGKNDAGGSSYFYDAPLDRPWFAYASDGTDSIRLGRLSEPTRFTGNTVKEKVTLESGRHCLFYSFRPIGLLHHSVVALFDYDEIARELRRLQQFIFISLIVSLIIVFVLARIMARSLIEPVVLLKQGVEQIEAGNFHTDVVLPGQDEIVELAQAFNKMSLGLDERERMTRYLSRSAVDAVIRGEDRKMGGHRIPATILFSDIRNFTTISESNSAEDVVGLLNSYFASMNQVVEKFGGDIDKFIGDAIMAQFIAKEGQGQETVALDAVKCALEMMAALAEFNEQRAGAGLFPIKIGVGINSGEVIAGNIGSPGRMDRTVIGDAVNLASRLEGMSKLGKHTCIIISGSTLDLVRGHVEVERLAETMVKGKTAAVEMFEVIRLKEYN